MKLFLWKIIALFGVLLGSLGPQVAAGSPAPTASPEATVVQTETIPVVTASSDTTVIVSQSPGLSCAEASFQLGRFDLILWHACDLNLQLGQAYTTPVAVTNNQQNWPKLSVASDPVNTISSGFSPWSAPESSVANFITQVHSGSPERSTQSIIRQPLSVVLSQVDAEVNSDNSQLTIVMRC